MSHKIPDDGKAVGLYIHLDRVADVRDPATLAGQISMPSQKLCWVT